MKVKIMKVKTILCIAILLAPMVAGAGVDPHNPDKCLHETIMYSSAIHMRNQGKSPGEALEMAKTIKDLGGYDEISTESAKAIINLVYFDRRVAMATGSPREEEEMLVACKRAQWEPLK